MAHTYLLFDFGAGEERAQQAHRKLQGWKQAFRLDKKLQFKFERAESDQTAESSSGEHSGESKDKSAKTKSKSAAKDAKPAKAGKHAATEAHANGNVKLLVRLYFSPHEKLSEQGWLDRIPTEDPFKEASPKIVREGDPQFKEVVTQFDALD